MKIVFINTLACLLVAVDIILVMLIVEFLIQLERTL